MVNNLLDIICLIECYISNKRNITISGRIKSCVTVVYTMESVCYVPFSYQLHVLHICTKT